jgi:hypothetical protein
MRLLLDMMPAFLRLLRQAQPSPRQIVEYLLELFEDEGDGDAGVP